MIHLIAPLNSRKDYGDLRQADQADQGHQRQIRPDRIRPGWTGLNRNRPKQSSDQTEPDRAGPDRPDRTEPEQTETVQTDKVIFKTDWGKRGIARTGAVKILALPKLAWTPPPSPLILAANRKVSKKVIQFGRARLPEYRLNQTDNLIHFYINILLSTLRWYSLFNQLCDFRGARSISDGVFLSLWITLLDDHTCTLCWKHLLQVQCIWAKHCQTHWSPLQLLSVWTIQCTW